MQFDFGFRIDTGNKIGSGHFFRCLSIAKELIKKEFKVIFLVNNKQEIESHLDTVNIPFYVLKDHDEINKVDECRNYVKNISKLIIDLQFDNSIYSKLIKDDCKTIVIDDLGNKKIYSDLLFNGSIVNEFQNYSINRNVTKYFSGSKYIILRSEFEITREHVFLNEKIQKILLIFGGSDDEDITRKILPYFFDKKYDVTVIVGPSYLHLDELKKIIPNKQNFKIIHNEKNISHRFSEQDLVISSSGITAYELACLGIPSILIPVDEYQIKTSSEMEKMGFGINYGRWDNNFSKLDKLISFISDYSVREKMYLSGRKLVDGKGLTRVLEKIYEL
jgi:UDP-2,4-diacetamido-2,4,6-trideoxy-beta-L-altropyranose hydrolase